METRDLTLRDGRVVAHPIPGMIAGMPMEEYHQLPGTGKTGLAMIDKFSPAHYRAWKDEPPEESGLMRNGTLSHVTLLEPELFDAQYHVIGDNVIRNHAHEAYRAEIAKAFGMDTLPDKEGAKLLEASGKGKTIVKEKDVERAQALANNVRSHPRWKAMVEGAAWRYVEPTLLWVDERWPEILLRTRPDMLLMWRGQLIALDLKTTVSAHPDRFARNAHDLRYAMSAHMMQLGCKAVLGHKPTVIMVVSETSAPVCEWYLMADTQRETEWQVMGEVQFESAMNTLDRCAREQRWPSYLDGRVDDLLMPSWLEREAQRLNAERMAAMAAHAANTLGEENELKEEADGQEQQGQHHSGRYGRATEQPGRDEHPGEH